MTRTLTGFTIALATVTALGCLPSVETPTDGGTVVTYTKDVQPIFAVKCAPCHTTDMAGGHNIGTTYADAFKPVNTTDAMGCWNDADAAVPMMPKTIGECASISIMNGWMPMAMGCFNTPRPPACVSLAEQDVIAAWVAAGMPQ